MDMIIKFASSYAAAFPRFMEGLFGKPGDVGGHGKVVVAIGNL